MNDVFGPGRVTFVNELVVQQLGLCAYTPTMAAREIFGAGLASNRPAAGCYAHIAKPALSPRDAEGVGSQVQLTSLGVLRGVVLLA